MEAKERARLLIITHETIGPKMAGPGIRSWEIACALSNEFDVTLAASGTPQRSCQTLTTVGYDPADEHLTDLTSSIEESSAIMAMGPLVSRFKKLQTLDKPLIIDLYDPFVLERLTQLHTREEEAQLAADVDNALSLRLEGALGDFFICASERQRDFWLGTLLAAGRVNAATYAQDPTLRKLIDVVPHGIPVETPRKTGPHLKGMHPGIRPEDKLLIWNGGLWSWFDPLTLVDAIYEISRKRGDVKLFFAAGTHFDTDKVREMPVYRQTLSRCKELGLLDRQIFFGNWIPYDERGSYLLEADLAVSTHKQTLESHFSSRTRLLDCIWAGLPVVSTAGDPVTDFVVAHGLGRSVPPGDVATLAATILEVLENGAFAASVGEKAEVIHPRLVWPAVVQPIARFLDRVDSAADEISAARLAAEARRLTSYVQTLRQPFRQLHTLRRRLLSGAHTLLGQE